MRMRATSKPLVSICLPAYNAAHWIAQAIESALEQTWESFEHLIGDNASTDSTVEIARSYDDSRIRVLESPHNLGLVGNHNRLLKLSSGKFIKLLHADDSLVPSCVEQMVSLALEDERIGLVFSPREIVVYDRTGAEWVRMISEYHEKLGHLARNNDGRVLFMQLLLDGFQWNWIGEPTAVLLSRHALERSGLFNAKLRATMDLELWTRIMLTHRVGFIDKPMCIYRQHSESTTAANWQAGSDWLDRIWLLEGLLHDESLGPGRAQILHMRWDAVRRARRMQVLRLMKLRFDAGLVEYFRYRALPPAQQAAALHDRLNPAPVEPALGVSADSGLARQ
jgi:glycosyltransferase involved in cell wall biosynthesis